MDHTNLCQNLQRLLDRFCPKVRPRVRITFGSPVPKTENDIIRQVLEAILRELGLKPQRSTAMPQSFETTLNSTQKVLATMSLTDPSSGGDIAVVSIAGTVISGDGAFSSQDSAGNTLPPNQVFLISGTAVGDTVYQFSVQGASGIPGTANVTMHVMAPPEPITLVTFGAAEPK